MSQSILKVVLVLAYGPFVLMALLYLAGVLFKLAGHPQFLSSLVQRTNIPRPIVRPHHDTDA